MLKTVSSLGHALLAACVPARDRAEGAVLTDAGLRRCQVYVPWIPSTSGAGAAGPERRKNIHARPKTIASATSMTAKLGGRRVIRPARTSRLVRSEGRVIGLGGVRTCS